MDKLDFKKILKHIYSASKVKPTLVEVPAMKFIMIDGKGDPNNNPEFVSAVEALYSVAYTIKFIVKKGADPVDFTVMPLEGLWWMARNRKFDFENRENWRWTLMIMQPKFVNKRLFDKSVEEAFRKKGSKSIRKIRFESLREGKSAQILHVGPYSEELTTIEKLHQFVEDSGLKLRDKHHEIYLSDPRKSSPEKLRTILRHPVQKGKRSI